MRDFFADADRVSAAVEPVKEEVARWAEEAADTTAIQASRSERLARYWNRLPDFLEELEPTMAELSRTARHQVPTLRKLGNAAPELERFLRASVPFARESRESIDDLGEAADAGNSAVREAREEVAELAELSTEAPRLAKPLRQFLQTIDDRRRSTESDPLAAQLAPPAPDKTADAEGRGFTGMEGFWNYIYWQTLGINAFDEFGHLLRIVAFTGGPCSPYAANPSKAVVDECASWLGPTQPGVLGQPDPTERAEGGPVAASAPEGDRERRGAANAPGPGALPERRNLPLPGVPLPDDVRELLDRLKRERGRAVPDLPGPAPAPEVPTELLDYLLGA
jgi:hypothetical protein